MNDFNKNVSCPELSSLPNDSTLEKEPGLSLSGMDQVDSTAHSPLVSVTTPVSCQSVVSAYEVLDVCPLSILYVSRRCSRNLLATVLMCLPIFSINIFQCFLINQFHSMLIHWYLMLIQPFYLMNFHFFKWVLKRKNQTNIREEGPLPPIIIQIYQRILIHRWVQQLILWLLLRVLLKRLSLVSVLNLQVLQKIHFYSLHWIH